MTARPHDRQDVHQQKLEMLFNQHILSGDVAGQSRLKCTSSWVVCLLTDWLTDWPTDWLIDKEGLLKYFSGSCKLNSFEVVGCVFYVCFVPPLLKLFRWDESCTQVAVSQFLGLPPCLIILTDHLQDVSTFKWKPCLLARRGFVLQRSVIKQRPHKDLKKTHGMNGMQIQWTRQKQGRCWADYW